VRQGKGGDGGDNGDGAGSSSAVAKRKNPVPPL